MGNTWQLQEAKNKFSSLVEKARKDGPQFVTKHGQKSVVVISLEDYQKLSKPEFDLVSFLENSPLFGLDVDTERDKSPAREIDL